MTYKSEFTLPFPFIFCNYHHFLVLISFSNYCYIDDFFFLFPLLICNLYILFFGSNT